MAEPRARRPRIGTIRAAKARHSNRVAYSAPRCKNHVVARGTTANLLGGDTAPQPQGGREGKEYGDPEISRQPRMSVLPTTQGRTLTIPSRSLVLLIGPSGSGKSTFARKHFSTLQVIESDRCRALVCDNEADQSATRAAFELLHFLADKRLEFGRLTVIDATNVEVQPRRSLLALARDHNFALVAIVFDVSEEVALRQNSLRRDRQVAPAVIHRQYQDLQSSRKALSREGFSRVYVMKSPEEAAAASVVIG